jgi:hypothetical protein
VAAPPISGFSGRLFVGVDASSLQVSADHQELGRDGMIAIGIGISFLPFSQTTFLFLFVLIETHPVLLSIN